MFTTQRKLSDGENSFTESSDKALLSSQYRKPEKNSLWNSLATHRPYPSSLVQTKLSIGTSNDSFEREADQVAEQVLRMPVDKEKSSISNSGAK